MCHQFSCSCFFVIFFFFKQKTAYEMRISDWSSDVCSSDLASARFLGDYQPMVERGGWNFWVQQVAWGTSKDLGDTAAYDIGGWGATAGVVRALGGAGFAGITIGAALGPEDDGSTATEVSSAQSEITAHWRRRWGGSAPAA